MTPEGGHSRGGFYTVITEAVAYFATHGYESADALDEWMARIRRAALETLTPESVVDAELRRVLAGVYQREIDRGAILKRHPGVSRFTLENVKPKLRRELDRRVMASAQLIRLNRQEAIEGTLRRFSGWASSVPAGGSDVVARIETKREIRKALAQLPFQERRVAIDQGHKFVAALNSTIANDAGALAGKWHSHYRQRGYNARIEHAERDGHVFAIRGNWAIEKGLMKPGPDGYTDQIEAAAELPFCRCFYRYIYALRSLPDYMLTERGRAALSAVRAAA